MANGTIKKSLPSKIFVYDVSVDYEMGATFWSDNLKALLSQYATVADSLVVLNVSDSSGRCYCFTISCVNSHYFKVRILSYYGNTNEIREIEKNGTSWKKIVYTGTATTF